MSLNWSIEKCRDWESISPGTKNGHEGTVTHSLIWAAISVKLGSIKAENVDEWVKRLAALEELSGTFMYKKVGTEYEPYSLTREDIERRIGMTTNVRSVHSRFFWADIKRKKKAKDKVK